jgi:hypothetical protein
MTTRALIDSLVEGKIHKASGFLKEVMKEIVSEKMKEVKKIVAAKMSEADGDTEEALTRLTTEARKWFQPRKQGRLKLVPIRVRTLKGSNRPVVQRRKKFSAVKGFTMRGGKIVRMKSAEKLHRKRGARRAKIKRRAKRARIHMKFERSLRKRKSLGIG